MSTSIYTSLQNCTSEMGALVKLVESKSISKKEFIQAVQEIQWNLESLVSGVPYISDEFRCRLKASKGETLDD